MSHTDKHIIHSKGFNKVHINIVTLDDIQVVHTIAKWYTVMLVPLVLWFLLSLQC